MELIGRGNGTGDNKPQNVHILDRVKFNLKSIFFLSRFMFMNQMCVQSIFCACAQMQKYALVLTP